MRNVDPPPFHHRRSIGFLHGHLRPAVAVAIVASLGVLVACSGSGEATSQASSSTTATSATNAEGTTVAPDRTTTTEDDPTSETDPISEDDCVTAAEVAEVVGSPVQRQLSFGGHGGEVSYSSEGCSYDLEGTESSVGIARLRGDGLDGPELYDALESDAAASSDEDGFERIDDLGDEAYRDGRKLVVLHGPQVLLLAYSPTGDSDDRNPDKALRVAMAVLPLDVSADPLDCDVVGTALEDQFGPVDRTMSGGGVDAVNDASLEYRSCTLTFDDGGEAEVGVADAGPFAEWAAGKRDSVFSTTFEATSVGELRAFDNGDELFVDDGGQPLQVSTEDLDLDDEAAAALRISLAELALSS